MAVGFSIWLLSRPEATPRPGGERVATVIIDSKAVGEKIPVSVVSPREAGGRPRSLLVFLHGRGQDERTLLGEPFFAAYERLGADAPLVAFPYGGEASYFHDRDSGDWGRLIAEEVIPRVAPETTRVAVGGISMGGFGAYDLGLQYPGRFCALGGHSPALWETAAETPAGAFDDAEDFAAHDVIAAARAGSPALTDQPVWLDVGDDDPFVAAGESFVAALEEAGGPVEVKRAPGGHTLDYWNSNWDRYLGFYEKALRDCR